MMLSTLLLKAIHSSEVLIQTMYDKKTVDQRPSYLNLITNNKRFSLTFTQLYKE